MPGAYDEFSVELRSGDRLCLYSDGVPEAMNAQKEIYGTERMLAALAKGCGRPIRESLAILSDELRRWSEPIKVQDDQTILCVERE